MNVFKRIYFWIDERLEMHDYIKKDILDKPIPKGLNLSFCFGGITFFLFVMLAVTGYFMTLYYVPSPEQAYDAVDYMTFEVPLGYVVRGVHHWSANLMIVTIFIHMLRVFIYGAYNLNDYVDTNDYSGPSHTNVDAYTNTNANTNCRSF